MAEDQFGKWIEVLETTPHKVRTLLQGLSDEQLRLKQDPDQFSLKECVLQLRDLELESYRHAIHTILLENRPALSELDLARLTRVRRYQLADVADALERFTQTRQGNLAYLRNMTEFQWNRKAMLGGVEATLLQLVGKWSAADQAMVNEMEQLLTTINKSAA